MPVTRTSAFAATGSTADSMDNEGGGQMLARRIEGRAAKTEAAEEQSVVVDEQTSAEGRVADEASDLFNPGSIVPAPSSIELSSLSDIKQLPVGSPPPTSIEALLFDDAGGRDDPQREEEWRTWVAATSGENWIEGDPLLDWLELYGEARGFTRDDHGAGYDPRTDFHLFLASRAARFETAIIKLLGEQLLPVELPDGTPAGTKVEVLHIPSDMSLDAGFRPRSLTVAGSTVAAMAAGAHIIAGGALRNPQDRTYGAPDLLVRSDVLEALFPGSLSGGMDEAVYPALGLAPASLSPAGSSAGTTGVRPWHYVVVDIKFRRLDLVASGHVGSDHRKHAVQVYLYNQALSRIQGHEPTSAYLLGRGWRQGKSLGDSAFERLGRIDMDHIFGRRLHGIPGVTPGSVRGGRGGLGGGSGSGGSIDGGGGGADEPEQLLPRMAADAVAWVRRVRTEGEAWQVLPVPSAPELFPYARNTDDAPWHTEKKRIAQDLAELTLLPGVSPGLRRAANAVGLLRWDQADVNAASLGVAAQYAAKCDAILNVNRDLPVKLGDKWDPARDGVLPNRIEHVDPAWRTPATLEFYVDFETVSSLDDDCEKLPLMGGQPLIFQIGCGWWEPIAEAEAGAGAGGSERESGAKNGATQASGPLGEQLDGQLEEPFDDRTVELLRRGGLDMSPLRDNEIDKLHLPSKVNPGHIWRFAQWTVDRLTEPEEARMIDAWVAHMRFIMAQRGVEWRETAVFHWAPAETSSLETAYNSARERHQARAAKLEGPGAVGPDWPDLPWFDFLVRVVRAEPVVFHGAFNFGLKSVAKAAYAMGLIDVLWGEGPTDGLGAMVGAWSCDAAVTRGEATKLLDIDLGRTTGAYNGVDCLVLASLAAYLRRNH
jgi:hypothetical protein